MTATRSNRIAQVLLIVMGFFVGIVLAIIVSKALLNDTSVLTKQQRKLEVDRAPVEYVRIPGIGRVAYQFLFEEISEQGETLDAFVLRVSPRLRAFSDATGFEACGVLSSDGERFGVVVGTNHAHIACINFSAYRPAGMTSVKKTLHSHGGQGKFKPNKADITLQGQHMTGRYARINTVHGQALDTFSEDDHRSGAGYLAGTNGRVYFQEAGTTREVK